LLGCTNTKHNDPIIRNHAHPNYRPQSLIRERVTEADLARLPDFRLEFTDE